MKKLLTIVCAASMFTAQATTPETTRVAEIEKKQPTKYVEFDINKLSWEETILSSAQSAMSYYGPLRGWDVCGGFLMGGYFGRLARESGVAYQTKMMDLIEEHFDDCDEPKVRQFSRITVMNIADMCEATKIVQRAKILLAKLPAPDPEYFIVMSEDFDSYQKRLAATFEALLGEDKPEAEASSDA